tara:strand:- start:1272 stop:2657 length:1386 start_codon:yes stop_codon:yes gene_type:complete
MQHGPMRIRLSALLLLISALLAGNSLAARHANILVIFADNMGYGDLGCYGCPDIKTPVIDKLATEGVRFTNYYSNGPECTPTRTGFFTGRYPQRIRGLECALGSGNVGRYDHAFELADRKELGMPPEKNTLVRLLKKAGYTAVGLGKWHLGYEQKFLPPEHGFDYFLAALGGTVDYWYHNEPNGTPVLYENSKRVTREGNLTDLITAGALKFLRERDKDQPFFLYLPYTAPSAPLQHPLIKHDKPKVSSAWDTKDWQAGSRRDYGRLVERLDYSVGKVLAEVDRLGLRENTLVIFASDNGGNDRARNAPFRGYTSDLFDGGIHIPCMARWPGVLPEGIVSGRQFLTLDLTVSILSAAGIKQPTGEDALDGIDILGAVASGEAPASRALFWRARRADRTWRAVRDGDLKFLTFRDSKGVDEYLFDLKDDPSEETNLFANRESDVIRLRTQLVDWEKRMEADW